MEYDDTLFRLTFPAFENVTKYPAARIEVFWGIAATFVDTTESPCRTLQGKQLAYALNALAAHLLTLATQDADAVAAGLGSVGGGQGGFVQSATIDDVTVTKASLPEMDMWEWWLAQTPAGQALMAFLKILAVGGFSVGGLNERGGFRKAGGVFW